MNFLFVMLENLKSGAAQHCFRAGLVWNPPVGWVRGILFLNEEHSGKTFMLKNGCLPERVILRQMFHLFTAALHRLKNQQISCHVLMNEVERKQWMAEVIKHPEK